MTHYSINFSSEALNDIKNLIKFVKSQVKASIDKLIKNPFMGNRLERDLKGLWSMHVGDYRIIYEIIEKHKKIIIYTVDSRKTVYRKKWLRNKGK